MCIEVFIAADVPLPLIPYAGSDPVLCVEQVAQGLEAVAGQFSKPFVY